MADVKISALPAASTPLAGTELVPIVQSGVTDQVTVANLTAGRTVDAATINVDANTANSAVRITQTGAGNALVVEDSASPDATPFVITAAGVVVQGNTTPITVGAVTSSVGLHVERAGFTGATVLRSDATTSPGYLSFGKSRSATLGSFTIVQNGDSIGTIQFAGDDGTDITTIAADVFAQVDGAPAVDDIPGRLIFRTKPAAGAIAERVRITSAGNVGIGVTAPVNRLQISGSFGRGAPVTKTGNFTLADTENWVICNGTGSITVTFPAASSWTGREVMIKTVAAQTVVSASSNVVPLAGGAAGTAILAASAGNWATLVSDGTNWVIMQA